MLFHKDNFQYGNFLPKVHLSADLTPQRFTVFLSSLFITIIIKPFFIACDLEVQHKYSDYNFHWQATMPITSFLLNHFNRANGLQLSAYSEFVDAATGDNETNDLFYFI